LGRTLLLTAAVMLAVGATGTAWGQTWDCGETPGTVTATLNGGTLTISGTGDMSRLLHGWRNETAVRESIVRIVIEYGVTKVGRSAFEDCTNLESVVISSSITYIDLWAFKNCVNLISVKSLNTVPPVMDFLPFDEETSAIACLQVPISGIGAYLSADGWRDFNCVNSFLSVTATFDSRGGSDVISQTVLPNSKLVAPADPILYGSAIDGWYKDIAYSQKWNFATDTVTSNITLYAKWSSSTITSVTNITGIPSSIDVGSVLVLNGMVVPDNATNTTIAWSIADAGTTGAQIYNGNRLVTLSDGIVRVKATVIDGTAIGTDYEQIFSITAGSANAVVFSDRAVPQFNTTETVAVTPAVALASEFTAGPNPVDKSLYTVNFFYSGSRITSATLYVYDASGVTVKKLAIRDDAAIGNNGKRVIGSWDLRDSKGRFAPIGTYLVKGAITTANGKREQVSAIVGVR